MNCNEEFAEALLRCMEAAYIIDEETKEVVWASDMLTGELKDCVGQPCWRVFLNKDEKCSFCPKLREQEFYTWDQYVSSRASWFKINNCLFKSGGKAYRAGAATVIDDAMRLNHDTVAEVTELQRLLRENQQIKQELERQASVDSMTGLNNRNRYTLDLSAGIFDGVPLGVLYFDLNNLKEVNDKYRHEAGDEIIKRLAQAIKTVGEAMPETYFYRVGGDEFVMLTRNASGETMESAAKAIYSWLEQKNAGSKIVCDVAMGLAISPDPCEAEALVSRADKNMYASKQKMKSER